MVGSWLKEFTMPFVMALDGLLWSKVRGPTVPSGWCYPPSQEKLPKKPSSCPSSPTQILLQLPDQPQVDPQGSASSSAPQKATPPTYGICILCVGWTILFFFLGFFFHTMGQGFWALPPFHINTNNEYCRSPSQGHKEFVSPAVPLIPHPSSWASRRYLCETHFRYSANI